MHSHTVVSVDISTVKQEGGLSNVVKHGAGKPLKGVSISI
jgi:hypothetical protein